MRLSCRKWVLLHRIIMCINCMECVCSSFVDSWASLLVKPEWKCIHDSTCRSWQVMSALMASKKTTVTVHSSGRILSFRLTANICSWCCTMMMLNFATPWGQRERNTNLVREMVWTCRVYVEWPVYFFYRMLLLHAWKPASKAQIFSEFYSASCTCEGRLDEHIRDGQGTGTNR